MNEKEKDLMMINPEPEAELISNSLDNYGTNQPHVKP